MTLLQALKELRVMAASGCVPHSKNGICANLQSVLGDLNNHDGLYFLISASPSWQHYDSSLPKSMPVKHHYGFPYWEGTNLNYRLSLINHMINKLEAGV